MPAINKAVAIFAVLAFLMPFVAISCNGTVIPGTAISGARLAQCAISSCTARDFYKGAILGGMQSPGNNAGIPALPEGKSGSINGLGFALFAAMSALGAALVLFLPGRAGQLLSGAASIACIVFLFLLRSQVADVISSQSISPTRTSSGFTLQIEFQFMSGFWLCMVMSTVSAILAFRGSKAAPASLPVGRQGPIATPSLQNVSLASQSGPSCPTCGAANAQESKFCQSCGGPMAAGPVAAQSLKSGAAIFCATCATANLVQNKFCASCGVPLS